MEMPDFTYDRTWEQIESMLDECNAKQERHLNALSAGNLSRADKMHHMRQYKGLEGAIATLRWVLGDPHADPRVGITENQEKRRGPPVRRKP